MFTKIMKTSKIERLRVYWLDLLDPFLSNVCSCTMGFLDNILNNVNAAYLGKRYVLL